MRSGYWVVAIFAAAWAGAGLMVSGYPMAMIAIPVIISAGLLAWAYAMPATAETMGPRVRAIVARWSMVEGGAIVVVANILPRIHHADALFPAVAIIVGLHFLPLARAIPVPIYAATGFALILAGAGGILLPAAERPIAIGLAAAIILWATALHRLLAARRAAAA